MQSGLLICQVLDVQVRRRSGAVEQRLDEVLVADVGSNVHARVAVRVSQVDIFKRKCESVISAY